MVSHLRFQLNLKEEDVQNLEKSLRMHEAYDPPSSAFVNEEEKPSKIKVQMTERINQLEIERDTYTRKLLELGKVYKKVKDATLIKTRAIGKAEFALHDQCARLKERVVEMRSEVATALAHWQN